ncbi:MAG: AraC family ligand binding domain-containing protein [Methylococcaceae bacterium]
MSILTIYPENQPDHGKTFNDYADIKAELATIDVEFEHWNAHTLLPADADQQSVLDAYQKSIDKLNLRFSFKSVDVINVTPDHPDKTVLRQKFLAEHVHDDFEVRFFIEGKGLFYLHANNNIYAVLCEAGDLISVPNNTPHWFDMGENPHFKVIRFFTVAEGWVAEFTGSDIAKNFPTFDQYVAEQA